MTCVAVKNKLAFLYAKCLNQHRAAVAEQSKASLCLRNAATLILGHVSGWCGHGLESHSQPFLRSTIILLLLLPVMWKYSNFLFLPYPASQKSYASEAVYLKALNNYFAFQINAWKIVLLKLCAFYSFKSGITKG